MVASANIESAYWSQGGLFVHDDTAPFGRSEKRNGVSIAAKPLGLSSLHKRSHSIPTGIRRFIYAKGGSMVRVFDSPDGSSRGKRVGGKRSNVSTFSYASRSRMMQAVNAVDAERVQGTFWGTMTCPGVTWAQIESLLHAWEYRVRRYLDVPFSILWRKEPHDGDGANAGSPHLHVLFVFPQRVPHFVTFRRWNDISWASVCGRPDIARTACRFEMLRSWRGAAFYAAKYAAKVVDVGAVCNADKLGHGVNPPGVCPCGCGRNRVVGRQWGIINRKHWPVDIRSVAAERPVSTLILRVLRKVARKRAHAAGRTVYCPAGEIGGFTAEGTPHPRTLSYSAFSAICRQRGTDPESFLAGRRALEENTSIPEVGRYRVKFSKRARFTITSLVSVWAESFDINSPDDKSLVFMGNEKVTRDRAKFTFASADFERVVSWASAEWLERLEASKGLPF